MPIIVYDGPPSWSIDASRAVSFGGTLRDIHKTAAGEVSGAWESTNYPWVEAIGFIGSRRKKQGDCYIFPTSHVGGLVAPATATPDLSNGQ